MAVHVELGLGSEQDEDEPDRDLDLQRVRHVDGVGQPDEGTDGLAELPEGSDQDRAGLNIVRHLGQQVGSLGLLGLGVLGAWQLGQVDATLGQQVELKNNV